ncbi:acetolactate synthase large subunit [Microbulbifer sp. A4B17]|uniref:acetolactate synthase large subunit n=1 Tax=Microbulbifer sp. A4B17 TaxID=359370 RepID=UPI000D52D050|nr:acetolactate synthase large subunit [Microbulbifer sp. A4B17]AWF82258.1 acetolactate synthase large subunit [Microbulbifer sp. A4B17]
MDKVSLNVSELMISCLENEGVEFIFGIPGEENIRFVDATNGSRLRFILARSEQAAAFMADMYGRVTGKAGVCSATLGPGAINLLLGVADAYADSTPLVAISAQAGIDRLYKETHQYIDLVKIFEPVTKSSKMIIDPESTSELIRAAFKISQEERPGACYLCVPEDIANMEVSTNKSPLPVNTMQNPAPPVEKVRNAIKILNDAQRPIVLVGHGAARANAQDALIQFSEALNVAVASTFHGKGTMPENHPNSLGVMGFMVHDYANFGFDTADVVICIGYELQEMPPARINPNGNKKIIYVHNFPAEVDTKFNISQGIEGDISLSLQALAKHVKPKPSLTSEDYKIQKLLSEEIEKGKVSNACPMKPQRVVADIREAMGKDDVVLTDTGAVKMWIARLYPAYKPNTCLISNGLATMAFALPGAIGVKLAYPDRKVLAVMGDGSFMMNSQEIETAMRENIPIVILILVDNSYGLIKWKMDLELNHHSHVDFQNPNFVKYAESFGATAYLIEESNQLLPTLKEALAAHTVSVIACPIDYSENDKLTDHLGELVEYF